MTAAVYFSMEIYFCQSVFVSQLQFLFGATKNVRTTKWPKVKKSTGLLKFPKPLYLRLGASIMNILNTFWDFFRFGLWTFGHFLGRHRIDFLKDLVAFVDLDLQSDQISANFRKKSAIAKKWNCCLGFPHSCSFQRFQLFRGLVL